MARAPTTRTARAKQKQADSCRVIIWLDQEPLRASVTAECTDAMARLDLARASWNRHEHKDKPAFARWRAREFGALLSATRDVEERIRDAQTLVHEVEVEMRRIFQDPQSAYQRVMFRRAHPNETAAEEAESARERHATGRPVSDFEKEALFQEWVKTSLGTNPDKMDDDAYSTSFEVFKSHMFRNPPENPAPARRPSRSRQTTRANARDEPDEREEIAPIDLRVKELYRRLVRRLHPDLRADGSAAVSALWHEVQEAYAASDVARLEILLALSDIEANRTANRTLGQMRAVLAELQRSLRALEKSLREAEREDGWDFARTGSNPDLRQRIERELKSHLAARTQRLELLQRAIADWAQGPVPNRKVPWANSRRHAI